MQRNHFVAHLTALAAALAFSTLAGCDGGDGEDPKAAGDGSYTSVAPGKSSLASKDGEATAGGSGAPAGDNAAPKVEKGDVVRLAGDRMLILNQFRGLQVVDVKDPTKPKRLGTLASTGTPRELYVQGETLVLVQSNAYEVQLGDGGKLVAWSGSRITTAKLDTAGQPQALGAVDVGGWIVDSRSVGGKIVLVTADTGWSPWWWGCWGPYGCLAEAGGATDAVGVGTKAGGAPTSGASSGDAAVGVAYPGGYWGWNVQGGSVHSVSAEAGKAPALIGSASFVGGVGLAAFGPDQVLVAGQRSGYDETTKKSWSEESLHEIKLDGGAKPTLGATWTNKIDTTSTNSWSWISGAGRVASGRLSLLRRSWTSGSSDTATLEVWQTKDATFVKDASVAVPASTLRTVTFADAYALVVHQDPYSSGGTDEPKKDDDGGSDDEPGGSGGGSDDPGSGSGSGSGSGGTPAPDPGGAPNVTNGATGLHVFDLSAAATITAAGALDLGKGWQGWGVSVHDLQSVKAGLWLLYGASQSGHTLRSVQLDAAGKPTLAGQSDLGAVESWSGQVEVLSTGLILAGVYQKVNKDEPEQVVKLLRVSADGKLTTHGSFAPQVASWWSQHSIEAGTLLYRASNVGLEIIDLKDIAKPASIGKLELAADVREVVWAGERLVALVYSQLDGTTTLRVLPAGGSDELAPEGSVVFPTDGEYYGYARLFGHGSFAYAVGDQGVRVFDITDPKAPKARGSWKPDAPQNDNMSWSYWSSWETQQLGATLYLTRHTSTWKPDDPACIGGPGGGTAVDGGSSGGGSGEVPPATDAGAAPDPDKPDAGGSEPADGGTPATDAGTPDAGTADAGTPDAGAPDDGKTEETKPDDGKSDENPGCKGSYVHTTTLHALDLSDPDKPVLGGNAAIKGASWTWGAAIYGKTLVMTHYESKEGADGNWSGSYWLDRFDLSKPTAPKPLVSVNVPGQVVAVSDDGARAWTLDWQLQAGTKPEDGKIENLLCSVKIVGDKAWILDKETLAGHAAAGKRVGDVLYLGLWQPWWEVKGEDAKPKTTLQAYKLGAKGELTAGGSADLVVGAGRIEAHGSWLFIGAGWSTGLTLWDITKPLEPTWKTWLPYQGWASQVVVGGDAVHLAGGWMGINRFPLTK